MHRCIVCLQEFEVFQGLETEAFMHLCKCTDKKRVKKGACLFRQGEMMDAVYLVKEGKLKLIQADADGRETIVDICGRGELLGALHFFREQPSAVSAVVMEEAKVCGFSRERFAAFIREDPSFALRIISYLGEKRYETMCKQGEDTRQTVKEKLLRLLYRLAREHGREEEGGTLIDLTLTQQELADLLGASRVMVAHGVSELSAQGVLSRRGRKYLLLADPCTSQHRFD